MTFWAFVICLFHHANLEFSWPQVTDDVIINEVFAYCPIQTQKKEIKEIILLLSECFTTWSQGFQNITSDSKCILPYVPDIVLFALFHLSLVR